MLGASGLQMFWRVTLPGIRWSLMYGLLLYRPGGGEVRRRLRGLRPFAARPIRRCTSRSFITSTRPAPPSRWRALLALFGIFTLR